MKKLFNLTLGGGGELNSSFKKSPAKLKKGFTLAEVLITLAIIGVVAAMTIPAVIVNTNQTEFKTGLRKAVSVLNSAITLNKALTGESPYDNGDLFNYLQQHMAVMKNRTFVGVKDVHTVYDNYAFYTTDGIRYEFLEATYDYDTISKRFKLYENPSVHARIAISRTPEESLDDDQSDTNNDGYSGYCGSMGLAHNPDSTRRYPCIITVDVNGDRKPSINNSSVTRKYADPKGRLLTDVFSIMITDQGAIPYGVVAQKAMYQAQK